MHKRGTIVVTTEEIAEAERKAGVWRAHVLSRRYTDRSGKAPEDMDARFEQDRQSAAAEIAAGRLLNRHVIDGDAFGGADLTGDIDVKWTRRLDGRMIVQKRSIVRGLRYLQVVGEIPTFHVTGWAPSGVVSYEKYVKPNPHNPNRLAHWLPQSDLLDWRLLVNTWEYSLAAWRAVNEKGAAQ